MSGWIILLVLVAALPASSAATAQSSERPANVAAQELARALLTEVPRTLGELESVVGSLDRNLKDQEELWNAVERVDPLPGIESLQVRLEIDRYHEDPHRTDPSLHSYTIVFASDRERIAPIVDTGARESGFRIDPDAPAARLHWSRVPEPPVRSQDEERALVSGIVGLIESSVRRASIERHLGPLVPDPEWPSCEAARGRGWTARFCPAGAPRPDDFRLSFDPKLPGDAIVAALQVDDPILMTVDVHMSVNELFVGDGSAPRLGDYRVEVRAEPRPGSDRIESPHGASLAWRADGLEIQSIRFERLIVLSHDRRRILHFNVTEHPTAAWTARQILEACGTDETPRYLVRDRDGIYGAEFRR